jgi:hypothetical protein
MHLDEPRDRLAPTDARVDASLDALVETPETASPETARRSRIWPRLSLGILPGLAASFAIAGPLSQSLGGVILPAESALGRGDSGPGAPPTGTAGSRHSPSDDMLAPGTAPPTCAAADRPDRPAATLGADVSRSKRRWVAHYTAARSGGRDERLRRRLVEGIHPRGPCALRRLQPRKGGVGPGHHRSPCPVPSVPREMVDARTEYPVEECPYPAPRDVVNGDSRTARARQLQAEVDLPLCRIRERRLMER